LAIFKKTQIKEDVNVEFRMEAFNLFNRVQFAAPSTDINGQLWNCHEPGQPAANSSVRIAAALLAWFLWRNSVFAKKTDFWQLIVYLILHRSRKWSRAA